MREKLKPLDHPDWLTFKKGAFETLPKNIQELMQHTYILGYTCGLDDAAKMMDDAFKDALQENQQLS